MTRAWRKGGTPDPDPTDAEIRVAIGYYAIAHPDTAPAYMAVVKALIHSAEDPAGVPAISDPIAWAEWALERRDEIPADTYYALTGPFARVMGRVHEDDVNPDGTPNLNLPEPDAWRRFPYRSAT